MDYFPLHMDEIINVDDKSILDNKQRNMHLYMIATGNDNKNYFSMINQ